MVKSIDFRNATFESLRGQLDGLRAAVYEAWVKHGPTTTRQLARLCEIDLLTLRPRTTELVQIGLVEVCEEPVEKQKSIMNESGEVAAIFTYKVHPSPHEGLYRAAVKENWDRWREGFINRQLQLI